MRDIDATMQDAFTNGNTAIAYFAEFEFGSGTLRLWTGTGNVVFDGETYTGAGHLGSISPYQETQSIEAQGRSFTLSGINSDLLSIALTENYQGRICRLTFAIIDVTADPVVLSSYREFTGLMDTMEIADDGAQSQITINAENTLALLKRKKTGRYTHEYQKSLYPLDDGLQFVAQLQDKEIVW